MTKSVSVLVYTRPDLTYRTLKALRKCEGISEYRVFVLTHRPIHDNVVAAVGRFPYQLIVEQLHPRDRDADQHYGVGSVNQSTATRRCFEIQFDDIGSDFAIHLEDDTLPAPDFLRYMEWADAEYRDQPQIFGVSGFNQSDQPVDPSLHYDVWRHQGACFSWGLGFWRDRWESFEPGWQDHDWDWSIVHQTQGRYGVMPFLSRIENIGEQTGVHPAADNHATAYWAGNTILAPGQWHDTGTVR